MCGKYTLFYESPKNWGFLHAYKQCIPGLSSANPWHSLNRTVTFAITRGQNKVYIPFLFYNYSIVQNVPFHFYGNFRSYVGMIADSATNGIERDE